MRLQKSHRKILPPKQARNQVGIHTNTHETKNTHKPRTPTSSGNETFSSDFIRFQATLMVTYPGIWPGISWLWHSCSKSSSGQHALCRKIRCHHCLWKSIHDMRTLMLSISKFRHLWFSFLRKSERANVGTTTKCLLISDPVSHLSGAKFQLVSAFKSDFLFLLFCF